MVCFNFFFYRNQCKFSIYTIKQEIFFVSYFVLVPFLRTCIHNLLAYGLQETSRLKAAYRLRTK